MTPTDNKLALRYVSNRKTSERKVIDEMIGRNIRCFLSGSNYANVDYFVAVTGIRIRMTRNSDDTVTLDILN